MIEHDGHVGKLLQALDDLGIADNTIVLYTTDNGPHMNTWPNTNWEGAFRAPCMIRWPGRIQPDQVSLELFSGLDWCPTLLAAAGDPDIKEKLLSGHEAVGRTFKVHLDGYDQSPYLTGQEPRSARKGLLLLQRRRRPGRAALRELEDRVHGAAGARHPAGVGRAVHPATRRQVLRSARRPVPVHLPDRRSRRAQG
jgi:arylsulfatase A-like enzyme